MHLRSLSTMIVVGVFLSFSSGCAGSKSTDTKTQTEANDTANAVRLYPNRLDAQPKDLERKIGESATVGGIAATVMSATFKQKLDEFEDKGYLVVALTMKNVDKKTHSYGSFDWKVQTPQGQVIHSAITAEQSLSSGDFVSGGNTSGSVIFEVGSTKGTFYVIYKPGLIDASRGIWQASI